jgi:hypothetical protein
VSTRGCGARYCGARYCCAKGLACSRVSPPQITVTDTFPLHVEEQSDANTHENATWGEVREDLVIEGTLPSEFPFQKLGSRAIGSTIETQHASGD